MRGFKVCSFGALECVFVTIEQITFFLVLVCLTQTSLDCIVCGFLGEGKILSGDLNRQKL